MFFRLPGAQLQTKIEHGAFLVVSPGQIRVAGRPGR
jgi:hypothetical protein